MTIVFLEKVERTHGSKFALGPISARLEVGVTCLVGANGAGKKTTLMRMIAGIDGPSAGEISIASGATRASVARSRQSVGFMPQEFALPGRASCEDFLYYCAWLKKKVARSDRVQALAQALVEVGLEDRRKSPIKSLSGGMRRRLCLAQAIINHPPVLVLDEPAAGLDPVQRVSLRELVSGLSKSRVVVYSTHLVEDVAGLADHVVALRDGQVSFQGDIPKLRSLSTDGGAESSSLETALLRVLGV